MKKVTKKTTPVKSEKASRPKAPASSDGVVKLPKANENYIIWKGLHW